MVAPTEDVVEELRDTARRDLYVFAKGVCGFDWLIPHIHMPLCLLLELYDGFTPSTLNHPWEEYEKVLRSQWVRLDNKPLTDDEIDEIKRIGVKRLRITLPRGWLKTTLVSQAYPQWRAIRNTSMRCLLAQNTFTNAAAKNKVIKETAEKNPVFRLLFPEVLPGKNSTWKAESLCYSRDKEYAEGTFEAAGTRTQVTSRHYNLIIEDDTVAPGLDDLGEENLTPSREDVDQAIGWHRLVLPLLVNPQDDQDIIVGTRWFEKDLLSWNRDNEPSYLSYTRACLEDARGGSSEHGEVTYNERFGEKVLTGLRAALGPYLFSCLYLNKPLRSADMVFHIEWFQYYETPPRDLACYTTVDLGGDPSDTKGEPDFNVVLTAGKDMITGFVYVLDYWRKKSDVGEVLNAIFDHVRRYHPIKVGIESVGYQKTLNYWCRERMRSENVYFMIEKLTHVKVSKSLRIMGLQPIIETGAMRFLMSQKALINELIAFPLGVNDDLADALASQIEMWQTTPSINPTVSKTYANDPMSVDGAIKELKDRAHNHNKQPLVYDIYQRNERLRQGALQFVR